jgi:diguanylate cyclase (GGDEF)-like protein
MNNFSLPNATLKYLGALGLIAGLSIGTHVLIASIVAEQGRTARVINLAGRQRMLSQRIAEEALEMRHADEPERSVVLARMNQDAHQMERANSLLTHGDSALGISSPLTQALQAIYERPPFGVDQQVKTYVTLVRTYGQDFDQASSTRRLEEILDSAREPLLSALDAAVTQYQADSDRTIRCLHNILVGVLALMLCTLIGEAIFIFRPMFRHLKATHAALVEAARTDPLTGSMNRGHFLETGEEDLIRCRARQASLCVIVLDIDHFKSANDQFGHMVGDRAIQSVVRCIVSSVRAGDYVGRIGGEEFAAIFPGTGERDARSISEKIRKLIETTSVTYSEGHFNLTVSIGDARWSEKDAGLLATIDRADKALYLAKRNGRNCVFGTTDECHA